MKRMLALILTFAMMLTMMPVQAFAAETEKTQYAVTWEYEAAQVTIEAAAVAVEGEAYSATLTEAVCCDVLSFDVRINKVYIDEAKYTYVKETGVLTIPAGIIDGDISIKVLSRQKHTEDYKDVEYPGTCMEVARTDRVRYCVECGEEFGVSSMLGTYAPHEKGTEPGRVEPTCWNEGGIGYYCKYGCGTLLIEEVLEPVPHTPGEPVLKGEWNVCYCVDCGWDTSIEYALSQREAAEKMLKMVNDLRAEHGLQPLQLTQEAVDLATLRAVELVTDYSHDSAGGYNAGYGENIAMGYTSTEDLFWGWYTSPGHLANMLGEGYDEFGFGLLPAENGQALYGVQLFSFHKDENRDHNCDRGCTGTLGDHADTAGDGDHICDYCKSGESLTQCSGGTATCLEQAVCEECGARYGQTNPDNHASADYAYIINEDGTHTAHHACCDAVVETAQHSYENESCACGKQKPKAWGDLQQLYWELSDNGLLTVTGTGSIAEFPWKQYSAQIEAVIITDGITAIGTGAFEGCSGVKSLSFPGSARVERNAFSGCTGLKEITVTAGSGAMCDYDAASGQNLPWFQTKGKDLTVKFDRGVTAIGSFAFFGAAGVSGVELPGTLKTIGASAFQGSALTALIIPEGVERIDSYALAGLKNIQTLTVPQSVTALGEYALSASSFRAVELSAGLTAISKGLFKDCTDLNTVILPESIQTIGEEAFYNCTALYGINVPKNVTVIEKNTFRNCTLLNNICLPETLTTIGEYAFAGDENLTKLTIPAGVAEIRQSAFSGCKGLDIITVNTKTLAVGDNAFSGCSNLKKIYFIGTDDEWAALLKGVGSGNNCLKTANVICAGEDDAGYKPVQVVHILDISGVSGQENAILDGRILTVDLNKVKSIVLHYQVLPADATNPEISWTTNDMGMTDSSLDAEGKLTLTNMKPGDMTLYAQNFGSDSNADYTYTTTALRLQFRKMEISGGHNGYISKDVSTQLAAQILGDGEVKRGITWSVQNQDGEAVIDSRGVITGVREGKVTVRAEAADGSGLVAEQSFTVSGYAVVIEGPDTVAAGKTVTLKAELVPENLTGTTIKWSLENPEDAQYVTLSNGKLTAKKGIQDKHNVTVVAGAADGQAASARKTVTVVPVTSSVTVSRDGVPVTGQTVLFDLNRGEKTLTFAAVTAPADADKRVNWTVSDTKGAYVTYTTGDEGTVTLTPTGKTGTVTLTATAADGSGKKAAVKVQFARTAQNIEILNAPKSIRAGSKMTLSTNLATEEGLTDRNVVWSLDEKSLPFASISAKGVLTAYAFPEPVTITVYAAIKANPGAAPAQVQIDLVPGAQSAWISRGGKVLAKGETVYAEVGEEVILSGGTLPEMAGQGGSWKVSGKTADWTPSEDGKTLSLRMKGAGSATVTFTAGDGSKKSTSVKVQTVQRGKELTITAKDGATQLRSGKSLQLTATAIGASVKTFRWTVSDPAVATVSATGKVKALAVYENTTVTVTATAIDGSGLTASYTLTVKPAKDETFYLFYGNELLSGTRYLDRKASAQPLTAKVYNAAEGAWKEVKDALITVKGKSLRLENGSVIPSALGSATVTAKYGKLSAKATFTVVTPVKQITITAKDDVNFLLGGKTLKLTAAVTGADGVAPTVKKVRWSVDNTAAATVSASGALKAAKNLTRRTTVTVTAEATDGSSVKQTFRVEIYPQVTAILVLDQTTGRVLNMCTREFAVGDKLDLAAMVYPADAMQDVRWEIKNKKLAHFDENGDLILDGKGSLTIKATVNDGSKKSISVKIKII